MTYPVNNFYSSTYTNVSVNSALATSVFDTSLIPSGGYALILSIIASNKSPAARGINLTLQKSGSVSSAHILYDVAVSPQTSFEVIQGSKFVLQRGDSLKAWVDSAGTNSVDAVISYVIYTPAT